MKISKILNQTEVPFVDIDMTEDTALFVDPLFIEFISSRKQMPLNSLSLEATKQIDAFLKRYPEFINLNQQIKLRIF